MIEHEVAELAAAVEMHLRFDKVARRVIAAVQASLAGAVADQRAVLFTVTAPIRQPGRTIVTLDDLARRRSCDVDIADTVHGNRVHIRWLDGISLRMPKVLGFVHNPGRDPRALLDLVEAHIRKG